MVTSRVSRSCLAGDTVTARTIYAASRLHVIIRSKKVCGWLFEWLLDAPFAVKGNQRMCHRNPSVTIEIAFAAAPFRAQLRDSGYRRVSSFLRPHPGTAVHLWEFYGSWLLCQCTSIKADSRCAARDADVASTASHFASSSRARVPATIPSQTCFAFL